MARAYSVYEAKARLSEILRLVRERRESVVVTWHGEPVAEIRPVEAAPADDPTAARIRELEARGVLVPARRRGRLPIGEPDPAALDRFLTGRE